MIKIFHDKDTNQTWALTLNDEGVVHFYDCRYEHTDLGQFVSSYYANTLLDHTQGVGLDLMGYEPTWKIKGKCMDRIVAWLEVATNEMRYK